MAVVRHYLEFLRVHLGQGLEVLYVYVLGACFGGRQDPLVIRKVMFDFTREEETPMFPHAPTEPLALREDSFPETPLGAVSPARAPFPTICSNCWNTCWCCWAIMPAKACSMASICSAGAIRATDGHGTSTELRYHAKLRGCAARPFPASAQTSKGCATLMHYMHRHTTTATCITHNKHNAAQHTHTQNLGRCPRSRAPRDSPRRSAHATGRGRSGRRASS